MFKDINSSRIFAGVYMTGIFPVKKYKTESALNNFREYSMIDLGYLSYDWNNEECFIPNTEVSKEMANAVKSKKWKIAGALWN